MLGVELRPAHVACRPQSHAFARRLVDGKIERRLTVQPLKLERLFLREADQDAAADGIDEVAAGSIVPTSVMLRIPLAIQGPSSPSRLRP